MPPPLPPPGPLFARDAATLTEVRPTLPEAPPLAPYPGGAATPPPLPPLPAAEPVPGRGRRFGAGALVGLALVCAVLASVVTGVVVTRLDDGSQTASAGGNRLVRGEPLDIQALLTKAQPSVVAIQTGEPGTGLYGGAGTGLVIDADGYVLTNYHVVAGSTEVQVTLHDGSQHAARLVGGFPDDDIALVQLTDPPELVAAELGSSDEAEVGDDVVAIGNALNLGGPPSVTEGIISAKGRTIETPDITLFGLLQTDAAINPGNSGGPLLNAQGQVIGINTAIISDAQNIGFAIPIDGIRSLIDELRDGKGDITPDTAFLGVVTQSVGQTPRDVLDQYSVSASVGAFVTDVLGDSAAGEAGLQAGDVITEIEGQRIEGPEDVRDLIRGYEAGDRIVIEYERNGRKTTVTVTLRTREDSGN